MLAGLEKRKRFQGYSTPHTVSCVVPLQSVVCSTHAESGPPLYQSIHLLAAKDIAVRSVGLWVYGCGGTRLACMGQNGRARGVGRRWQIGAIRSHVYRLLSSC